MKTLPINITREQRDNLKKLADYLLSGNLKSEFNMDFFTEVGGDIGEEEHALTACGTVGCAIGHGPHAGIPKSSGETWIDYSDRCFTGTIIQRYDQDDFAYYWCFSSDWTLTDNTPEGAAKRILWMLENNGVPYTYVEQMEGDAPLCYVNPSGSTKTPCT